MKPRFHFLAVVMFLSLVKTVLGVTASEYYNAGLQLLNAKNYPKAAQYFGAAISLEPNNTGALQGRANCYYSLGQYPQALTDYEKVQSITPSEQLSQFIQSLRAKVNAPPPPAAGDLPPIYSPANQDSGAPGKGGSLSEESSAIRKGGRIRAGFALLNLADFTAHVEASQAEATFLHSADSSYSFTGSVPTGAPMLGVEGNWSFGPHFEVGAGINFVPMGTVKTSFQNIGSVVIRDSFELTAIPLFLDGRYLMGSGSLKPHISIGFVATNININYSEGCTVPTYINTATGSFKGFTFGGQAELGVDWHPAESIAFSPFVSYQVGGGNSFTSTMDIVSNGVTMSAQPVQLYVVPTSNGNVISVVSNGNLITPVADGNSLIKPGKPVPAGSRPLAIDSGGPTAGVQFSYFF